MKNIMITDIYWEKSAWTLHIHETHVRLQCHSLFMSVKKLSVCGDVGLTTGHTSLKVRLECSRACHFWKFIIFRDEPLEGDFHWGLMTSSFIIYGLGRSWWLAGGEPCKWWVQHVAFRTHCNVRDQSNLSQGSLHSVMQGLNNPMLWPSQSLSEPWKPRWTLPLVHYKMLPYPPRSHDVPQGKI